MDTHNLPLKVTTEQDAANNLEVGEAVDLEELSVVDDGQATNDLSQSRKGDISQGLVVDERDSALDLGEVGSDEGLHLGVHVELEGGGDALKQRNRQGASVGNLDLGGRLKERHGDLELVSVVVDDELGGDVDQVRLEGGETVVVVDVDGVDRGKLEARQAVKVSIGDTDNVGLGHTLSTEHQASQLGETVHLELLDRPQRIHLNGIQRFAVVKGEGAIDGGDGVAGEGEESGDVGNEQVSVDLLRAIDDHGTSEVLADNDVGLNDLAVDHLRRLADLDIPGACLGCDLLVFCKNCTTAIITYQQRSQSEPQGPEAEWSALWSKQELLAPVIVTRTKTPVGLYNCCSATSGTNENDPDGLKMTGG